MPQGPGGYRDAEARQRAEERASRQRERDRQASERRRAQEAAAARDREAERKTQKAQERVEQLRLLLRDSLGRDPRIDLAARKRVVAVPPLDLGDLLVPVRPPAHAEFLPAPPGVLGRLFGGQERYEAAVHDAEDEFARAQDRHTRLESDRQRKVVERRRAHEREVTEAGRAVAVHNAEVEAMATGLRDGDRYAVSDYLTMVLKASPYPKGFPNDSLAGYVPESSLLAVQKYLPSVEIIPPEKSFRHVKTRKEITSTARPLAEIRQLYQSIIAQVALRTLCEVFDADSAGLITTVVFNGLVRGINSATGRRIEPCLITFRATREQFSALVLDEPKFNPVDCIRRHFFAEVSQHPDELLPVEPVMPYSMADPRAIDPIDIISGIDKRPNLIDLTAKEFEAFIQNLFAKMGFDTQLFQASGDGGVDCVAYDPHPITGGKFIIQAKLYNKTVSPTHVRDLWGTVQHEGATKGILITTSGYGPDSFKFANGKPLNLIDGHGLQALCQQHGIPARIVLKKKP